MNTILSAIFFLLNLWDARITDKVIANGGKEVAPIKWLFGEKMTSEWRWAFKMTVCVLALYAVWTYVPWPFDWLMLLGMDILFAWVVWHNISVLKRQEDRKVAS